MKKPTLERLTQQTLETSTQINVASLGLLAIADLLGADNEDHNLNNRLREGLFSAVKVLARSIQTDSNGLYFFADEGGEV